MRSEPYLVDLLLDESVKIIGQNIKYDWKVLHQTGLDIPQIHFDTMVAAWMLESNYGNYGMDDLAETYLGYRTISFKDTVPKGQTFADIPLETAAPYAAEDADITFRLYEHFLELLNKRGSGEAFLRFGDAAPRCPVQNGIPGYSSGHRSSGGVLA
jgi:DNA polymerase-1